MAVIPTTGRAPWERTVAAGNGRSEDLICTRWGLGSIFLTDDDAAKLVAWDFEDRENLPPYGPLGSPAFTPPEWLAAEDSDVSPAADVYRVGCALYSMLTGRLPFVGESAVTVLHRILEGPPAPVRKVAPDVPEGVAALCMKCLARDSEERYPELGAFMLALSSLMANRPPR